MSNELDLASIFMWWSDHSKKVQGVSLVDVVTLDHCYMTSYDCLWHLQRKTPIIVKDQSEDKWYHMVSVLLLFFKCKNAIRSCYGGCLCGSEAHTHFLNDFFCRLLWLLGCSSQQLHPAFVMSKGNRPVEEWWKCFGLQLGKMIPWDSPIICEVTFRKAPTECVENQRWGTKSVKLEALHIL